MDTKRTIGSIAAGCGSLLLLALTGWLAFVIYVGVQGRGRDEQASLILGPSTCCVMVPVLVVTIVGVVYALRKKAA